MKIFIDQGHNNSGWNTGAIGNGIKEQDISYEVGKKLSEKLNKLGIETKLSRETKEINLGTNNITSINERYKMSNNWGAEYFISLHCNAGGGTGTETLYYKENSKEYAKIIQETYIQEMKLKDRGIKYRDNIGVIKYAKAKAILIEMAFIDNKIDSQILKNKQEEIAEAITKGFCKLLKINHIENNKEENNNAYNQNNKEEENKKIIRYNKIEELPEWSKETIKKLVEKNYIAEKNNLNLSEDMLRILVINYRAGIYK